MTPSGQFEAFVATKCHDGSVQRGVKRLRTEDLGAGDILVRVEWSSVNYKDALALEPALDKPPHGQARGWTLVRLTHEDVE